MREAKDRVLGYAVLASLLAHAILLAALPRWRELSAPAPAPSEPLIARVERLAPPPVAKPVPPPPQAMARPIARPAPKPRSQPRLVPEVPAPAATQALPAAPAPEPVPAPAPAPPPAPQVRIDPRLLMQDAPPPPAIDPRILGRYSDHLHAAAERFKKYPRVAIDNAWEGEVRLRLQVAPDGSVADLRVARGSGYEVLDRQAEEMFRSARPFVALPAELRGKAFDLELRVIYNLRNQPSG